MFWSSRDLVELFLIQSRITSSWLLIYVIEHRVISWSYYYYYYYIQNATLYMSGVLSVCSALCNGKLKKPFIKDYLILTCVVLCVYCTNIPCIIFSQCCLDAIWREWPIIDMYLCFRDQLDAKTHTIWHAYDFFKRITIMILLKHVIKCIIFNCMYTTFI